MIQIFDSLKDETYQKFIQLLLEQSDSFIFNVPNMGKTLVNERNAEFMPEHKLGYTEEFEQDLHYEYIKKIEPYIDFIKDDTISVCTDTGYLNQVSNLEIQVYHMSISEKSKDFFAKTNNFEKWLYPEFPEDPCFLKNKKCVFQCISHEELFFLYSANRKIRSFLKDNNIKYKRMFVWKIPRFK